MPLTDHIEEMVKRLAVVIVIMALVSAVVFPIADRLINFLWYSFLPGQPSECVRQAVAAAGNFTNGTTGTVNTTAVNATVANASAANASAGSGAGACPRLYHPLALVLARLKVASLGGFIVALPVFVYQTYLFMRPGLYPHERRYYLASVPTSLVLAAIGVAFAYLLVLPIIFTYFLGYSQPVAAVAFGLTETFDLILLMLGMFAAIFQIPLFVMLAIMMGVTTRRWLESRRLYFWFGFAGVAFLFSPDPTGMAPFIVALTMIVLFEGTLLLLRWTGR
jgi:sec-independent protein translocase protein TatC